MNAFADKGPGSETATLFGSRSFRVAFHILMGLSVLAAVALHVGRSEQARRDLGDLGRSAVLERLVDAATRTGERHQVALRDFASGKLTQLDLANRLERETLPEWRLLAEHAAAVSTDARRHEISSKLEALAKSLALRRDATARLIAAVRAGDESRLRQAEVDWAEAGRTGRGAGR